MSILKNIILLLLIYFSLQNDENCLANMELCYEKKTDGSIDNCLYYNTHENIEKCFECEAGYSLSYDQTKCEKLDENCQLFAKGTDFCGFCNPGYARTVRGTCAKSENCSYLLDDDNIKCKNCIKYFRPDENGICQKTFCSQYSSDYRTCYSCYNGYILDKNTNECIKKKDPYCEEFEDDNGEGDCIECVDGYYLDKNTKQCKKINIPYCIELDEEDTKKCKECGLIFTLDENGKCVYPSKLIPGCLRYNDKGECTSCFSHYPYYYKYDEETKTCVTDSLCNDKVVSKCFYCKPGYFLDDEGLCMGYDGTRDTHSDSNSNSSSDRNKMHHILFLLILSILI